MASIYFMRHAESESNVSSNLIDGRQNDLELTEQGRSQAIARGQDMKRQLIKPNIVAVSPAVRTRETARLALGAMDYRGKVYIDPDLQEVSQADFEGMSHDKVWTTERLQEIAKQGIEHALPANEWAEQLGNRMYQAARKLNQFAEQLGNRMYQAARKLNQFAEHADYSRSHNYLYLPPHALAITHETAIKALVARIEGHDKEWIYETRLANASLTLISFSDHREHVHYVGQTC